MWGRAAAISAIVLAVVAVEYLLIRSTVGAFREDLRQRPNCALVDDAVKKGQVPDEDVKRACAASARGLVYSLSDDDLRLLRRPRR
jgi:hypothetical protein